MREVVIVDGARTPFGRAHKGNLRQTRAEDLGAIAVRALGTCTSGTPKSSGCSTTSATAPCSTAPAANSWPSLFSPRTQKKSVPGVTLRLS